MNNSPERKRLPVSVSSAVFIEDKQGRLLLLQQASENKGHRWGPPAGGIEAHENPVMGALREAREEIGVEVQLIDLVGIYTIDRGSKELGIGFAFRGLITLGDMVLGKGEITDARYFTPDEIRELIATDMLYKPEYNLTSINDWLHGQSYPLEVVQPIIK